LGGGGAFLFFQGTVDRLSVRVQESNFTSCLAGNFTVVPSFEKYFDEAGGGALSIYLFQRAISSNLNIKLIGLNIASCAASNGGGILVYHTERATAFSLEAKGLQLSNCSSTFGSSLSLALLGPVLMSSIMISESSFTDSAGIYGLVLIYAESVSDSLLSRVHDCTFSGANTRESSALAFLFIADVTSGLVEVKNTKFVDCTTSDAPGGGLSIEMPKSLSSTISVSGCTFNSCQSTKWSGGAMAITFHQGADVTQIMVQDCIFIGCAASAGTGSFGGAISIGAKGEVTGGATKVSNCTFNRCVANSGGGIAVSNSFAFRDEAGLFLEELVFSNCVAYRAGAAIYAVTTVVSPRWNIVIRNISLASSLLSETIGTIHLQTVLPELDQHNGLYIQNVTWDAGTAEDNFFAQGFWVYCDLGYQNIDYQCARMFILLIYISVS
jgi:hypothetical protein